MKLRFKGFKLYNKGDFHLYDDRKLVNNYTLCSLLSLSKYSVTLNGNIHSFLTIQFSPFHVARDDVPTRYSGGPRAGLPPAAGCYHRAGK